MTLASWVLMVAGAVYVGLAASGGALCPVDPTVPSVPAVTCQEDQLCWSCGDMGNRMCGPGEQV